MNGPFSEYSIILTNGTIKYYKSKPTIQQKWDNKTAQFYIAFLPANISADQQDITDFKFIGNVESQTNNFYKISDFAHF